MNFLIRTVRLCSRSLQLAGIFGFAALEHGVRGGSAWSFGQRANWLQRWSGAVVRCIGYDVRVLGTPPRGGFIAPNHLSYMDILVLSSVARLAFLSKSEVGKWPLIGKFTRMAGTLYIDRSKRGDVANKRDEFAAVMQARVGLSIFLEGTTSNGEMVLPFRSSLLQPLIDRQWAVTPAYIHYESEEGDVANEVCWWGDVPFTPHFLNMLKLKQVRVTVAFGETQRASGDRKELAPQLHGEVLELRDRVLSERRNAERLREHSVI